MLNIPRFSAVAGSRRRTILLLLAVALLMVPAGPAHAWPPPEVDEPDPGADYNIRLDATSYLGMVTVIPGLPESRGITTSAREAPPGPLIHLRGTLTGVYPHRYPKLTVNEAWLCGSGWSGGGSRGEVTTTVTRQFTIQDPEQQRCPNEGLYMETVTAIAYDPKTGLATSWLTIYIVGAHYFDDWISYVVPPSWVLPPPAPPPEPYPV